MIGQRFGLLTITAELPRKVYGGQAKRMVTCFCECGNDWTGLYENMKRGATTSCGCLRKKVTSCRSKTHGLSKHKLYGVWFSMWSRCNNENHASYKNYGARGIGVCSAWEDPVVFFDDNIDQYKKCVQSVGYCQIDRIDNNKGYSKKNVRWVSRSENNKNKRVNRIYEMNGEKKCLTDWAKTLNVSPGGLKYQIEKRGSFVEAANYFNAKGVAHV